MKGFSLIELMVTVAILAILATLAFPSYQNSIARGDRANSVSDINNIAQAMERYYTYNRVYTNNFVNLAITPSTPPSIATSTDGNYTYTLSLPGGVQTYQILSVPVAASTSDTLQLRQDQTGLQERSEDSGFNWVAGWTH